MHIKTCLKVTAVAASILAFGSAPTMASDAPDPHLLITEADIATYREMMTAPVIMTSINAQNTRRKNLTQDGIDALDKQWRAELKSDDQPLIAATLTTPASNYLMEIQARSIGVFAALFVMDTHGLNVGQSVATSDYWQGDEAKFQKTAGVGPNAVFIDEPEYYEKEKLWVTQINFAISEDNKVVGAATVEVNLTELARRNGTSY